MVKIRGYSVVLGAVEAAIASHPDVSTSVVIAEGNEGEDKRLVAYVIPSEWERRHPSVEDLRAHLRTQIPIYAMPSLFIFIEVNAVVLFRNFF